MLRLGDWHLLLLMPCQAETILVRVMRICRYGVTMLRHGVTTLRHGVTTPRRHQRRISDDFTATSPC